LTLCADVPLQAEGRRGRLRPRPARRPHLLGEAGDHRYLAGDTAVDATIPDPGRAHRRSIHPHGDGHHRLHDRWCIQWREKVLETVRTGLHA